MSNLACSSTRYSLALWYTSLAMTQASCSSMRLGSRSILPVSQWLFRWFRTLEISHVSLENSHAKSCKPPVLRPGRSPSTRSASPVRDCSACGRVVLSYRPPCVPWQSRSTVSYVPTCRPERAEHSAVEHIGALLASQPYVIRSHNDENDLF